MDDVDGFWAACEYAQNGDIFKLEAWLLRGGDANQVDSLNSSLGDYALRGCRKEDDRSDLIRLLASHGMDVNGRDIYRQSLLHSCQFPEEAAALIELGADVNATDRIGRTALFFYVAVPHHGLELIRLLLRHGCDAAAVNEYGEDVAAYAQELYDGNYGSDDVSEDEKSSMLAAANFLEDVKAAGGWKAYLRAPRVQLVRLRSLCDRGRAAPPSTDVASGKLQRLRNLSAAEVAVFARLFGAPTPRTPGASSGRLPNEIFWHILAFWRTDRD